MPILCVKFVKIYTDAVRGVRDKYQVCLYQLIGFSCKLFAMGMKEKVLNSWVIFAFGQFFLFRVNIHNTNFNQFQYQLILSPVLFLEGLGKD